MRLPLAVAVACAAWAAGPAAAMTAMTADGPQVSIGYAAYSPAATQALTGEPVSWTNNSVRTHTVTADDNSFDSGALLRGSSYRRTFAAPGTYGYYCRLHAGIVGTVDVHDALLDPVDQPAAPGRPYPLHGRAAAGVEEVTVEADSGTGFAAAGTATVADDGSFELDVTPAATTTYRVTTGSDTSPPVTLLVLDRKVAATAARGHGRRWSVIASVAPASPGAHVVLQLRLREHFGWWPVAFGRLDGQSRARFHVTRATRAPARVVLTLADDATPLAVTPTFRFGG